jgi:niacin transporter
MVHALCEVIVVTTFYWGNNMSEAYYKNGYFMSVIILVGIGTFVHSMVDLTIATLVWKPIQNIISIPASVRIARK